MSDYITLRSGRKFYPLEPARGSWCLDDIAHSLSNLCRWGGHTKKLYVVAQHSVFVCDIVRELGGSVEEQKQAMLHECAEALGFVDLPRPVKHDPELNGYRFGETRLQQYIFDRYNIHPVLLPLVKKADDIALATEAYYLIRNPDWAGTMSTQRSFSRWWQLVVMPWSPRKAKRRFLEECRQVGLE